MVKGQWETSGLGSALKGRCEEGKESFVTDITIKALLVVSLGED